MADDRGGSATRRRRDAYAAFVGQFFEPRRAQIVGCEVLEGRHDADIAELRRALR